MGIILESIVAALAVLGVFLICYSFRSPFGRLLSGGEGCSAAAVICFCGKTPFSSDAAAAMRCLRRMCPYDVELIMVGCGAEPEHQRMAERFSRGGGTRVCGQNRSIEGVQRDRLRIA